MNAVAHELGIEDGSTMARERIEDLTAEEARLVQTGEDEWETWPVDVDHIRELSGAKNFDEQLVNAVGFGKAAELFGVDRADEAAWHDALCWYEQGAKEGWEKTIAAALAELDAGKSPAR